MDGNKDDAVKCLNIGKAALDSGDAARARKFLSKAKRLDPSLPIDDLLVACEDVVKENGCETSASETRVPQEASVNSESSENARRESPNANGAASAAYTEEQLETVRRVKRNRDYYAILGLEKNCTVEDVRKAYRKLSLKVHPDKNKAPGSEDAFKAVSKAFQCLSNEEMRQKYDVTGPDEDFEVSQQRSNLRRRRTQQGFYEDPFDPDEIFRSFFFGNPQTHFFHRANVMRARAAAANNRTQDTAGGFNIMALLQVLPILVLFLFTWLPFSEPQYSLQKSYPYQFRKVTKDYNVPYYVRSVDFDKEYLPGSSERVDLERHVIRDYVNILGRYCNMEMTRRQFNRNQETPHCDKLRQFEFVR